MRPLPDDNQRPTILLTIMMAIAVAVVALTATLWVQTRSADRGYTTELRGAIRKYGDASGVPEASVVWLARLHERATAQVRKDLAAAATDPTAYDPDAPLHEEPTFLVGLYLDLGFVGLWLAFFCVGMLGATPVVILITRQAQPRRRRPRGEAMGWG